MKLMADDPYALNILSAQNDASFVHLSLQIY